MKRSLLFGCVIALSALLSVPVFTGCNEAEEKEASVSIASEYKFMIFQPGGEMEKTLSFESSGAWELSYRNEDWLQITPRSGGAGKATVTVKMLNNVPIHRKAMSVEVSSGDASEEFLVIQDPFKVEIGITAPPSSMFEDEEIQLEFTITPEGIEWGDAVWASSEEDVISIDQQGLIKGLKSGTSTISVTVDGYTAECTIKVNPFATPGDGGRYTFAALSQTSGSGITVENGDYVVNKSFVVSQGDYLVLEDNKTVRIKHNLEITINGNIDFTPATRAYVTRYDESAKPKRIYLTGDNAGGQVKNVTFTDVPLRVFGKKPLTVDNCEFKDISTNLSAIDMGTTAQVTVTNCRFLNNRYPAISGAANSTTPLVFKDNYLNNNTTYDGNRPQINVTVGGNGLVEISGNEIIGPAKNTKVGGIAVANLMGVSGTNKVIIKNNKVRDCRYGITTNGVMDVEITGNELRNNKWDSDPQSGGSGISLYNSNGGQKVMISKNIITGHLWGITVIGGVAAGKGPSVNMGYKVAGANYNVGENVLSDNGNNGVLYDLYNNSPLDMYAMNNTWGSVDQTEAEVEKVITHKVDNATLGTVTFMPTRVP